MSPAETPLARVQPGAFHRREILERRHRKLRQVDASRDAGQPARRETGAQDIERLARGGHRIEGDDGLGEQRLRHAWTIAARASVRSAVDERAARRIDGAGNYGHTLPLVVGSADQAGHPIRERASQVCLELRQQ